MQHDLQEVRPDGDRVSEKLMPTVFMQKQADDELLQKVIDAFDLIEYERERLWRSKG